MSGQDDEDSVRGIVARTRPNVERKAPSLFPVSSVNGAGKRARSAWFNRKTGAGAVKLAETRSPLQQRVIVKARVVVHAKVAGGKGGAGGLMRHALYVERDGAGRDGDKVMVFDHELDHADGAGFVDRCEHDRHHFRIIISPEFGNDFDDLRTYTRELMERVERDQRTQIDWIAAEHHDTGRPHIHLLMRGVRDDGRDLVIARDYISYGFRDEAEKLATETLGPRLERELDRRSERAATLERPTHLDDILRQRARDNEVRTADLPEHARGVLQQRLTRLEEWRLAERAAAGVWKLDRELNEKLIRLGDERDRQQALARLMAREDRGLELERTRALESAHSSQRIAGRLVGFERLGDDPHGPHLIGIEGVDGKLWTGRVARAEELRLLNGVERGAIVEFSRAQPDLKPSDRTIWEIARKNDLAYSAALHREARPNDRESYIQMHERRLEALRREGIVERTPDGTFLIPANYADRVRGREGIAGRESARVELLDPHGVERQARYLGPTWLDRVGDQFSELGFGQEARAATLERAAFLEKQGIGQGRDGVFLSPADTTRRLRDLERREILSRVERETGRVPHFARDGAEVGGVFAKRVVGAERSFALILQGKTATLVPWRAEMDRAIGQHVSGCVNGRDFNFTYGQEAQKAITRIPGLGLGR